MAPPTTKTRRTKSKTADIPMAADGKTPDIFVLVNEQKMTMKQATEAANVSWPKAHKLLWAQEVEHDPSLKISTKQSEEKLGAKLASFREQGVRWERLAARTGLPKTKLMELVAKATGVEPDELKRARKAAAEGEDPKAAAKTKKSRKGTASKAATAPVDEEDAEVTDEDVEDEELEEDDEDIEDEDEDDTDEEDDEEDDEDVDEEDEDEDEAPAPVAAKRGRRARK